MRLIHINTFTLEEFEYDPPPYAILSHVWTTEEVTFTDFGNPSIQDKQGFKKIRGFCDAIQQSQTPVSYAWVDTCCIDKSSSAELSEAINSMYKWYERAEGGCYVYLSDARSMQDLGSSKWFSRGWTLQELIAPDDVKFYNDLWLFLGTKMTLSSPLSQITGIERVILEKRSSIFNRSIAKRMSWAAGRQTSRSEDEAYCLLGIFDINMPLLYGEGRKAFVRLQQEIIKQSYDHSILAWGVSGDYQPILPCSVAALADSVDQYSDTKIGQSVNFAIGSTDHYYFTNIGLSIKLELYPYSINIYLAALNCFGQGAEGRCFIFLKSIFKNNIFERIRWKGNDHCFLDVAELPRESSPQDLPRKKSVRAVIRQSIDTRRHPHIFHGFKLLQGEAREPFSETTKIRLHEGLLSNFGYLPMPLRKIGTVAAVELYSGWDFPLYRKHEVVMKLGFDVDFRPYCEFIHEEQRHEILPDPSGGPPGVPSLLSVQNLHDDTWISRLAAATNDSHVAYYAAHRHHTPYNCRTCHDFDVYFVLDPNHEIDYKDQVWEVIVVERSRSHLISSYIYTLPVHF